MCYTLLSGASILEGSQLVTGELTYHCKVSHTIINTPQLVTSQANMPYCPCCNKQVRTSETDGWDYLAAKLNTDRRFAVHVLRDIPRTLDTTRPVTRQRSSDREAERLGYISPRYTKPVLRATTNADIAEAYMQAITNQQPTQTIYMHCSTCVSTFKFTAPARAGQLLYCPFCGTCTLVHDSTELSELATDYVLYRWALLACKYNLPLSAIQAHFAYWQTNATNYQTFGEFMTALPSILAKEVSPSNSFRLVQHTPSVKQAAKLAATTTTSRKIKITLRSK